MLSYTLEHVLRSAFDSLLMFLLVSGVIALFRVKNPSIKVFLYIMALVRPAIMLFEGVDFNKLAAAPPGYLRPNIRVVDPLNIVRRADWTEKLYHEPFYNTSYVDSALIILFFIISAVIILHIVGLALFYSRLKRQPEVSSYSKPELEAMLDELSAIAKVRTPELHIAEVDYPTPFTVGWINPTIVISKDMAEVLSPEIIKFGMAHEIVHIKRKDYLTRWIAIVLRDVLFFTPFSWLLLKRIEEQMEIACDSMASVYTGQSHEDSGKILFKVADYHSGRKTKALPARPGLDNFSRSGRILTERIDMLIKGVYTKPTSPVKWGLVLLGCLPLFFLRVAPMFGLSGRLIVL